MDQSLQPYARQLSSRTLHGSDFSRASHRSPPSTIARMLLVTGGAGFIGANFILDLIASTGEPVVNLDKLTYAGNPGNLGALNGDLRYSLVCGDINDGVLVRKLLETHEPRAIVHF